VFSFAQKVVHVPARIGTIRPSPFFVSPEAAFDRLVLFTHGFSPPGVHGSILASVLRLAPEADPGRSLIQAQTGRRSAVSAR
jgi:hypothetical protein